MKLAAGNEGCQWESGYNINYGCIVKVEEYVKIYLLIYGTSIMSENYCCCPWLAFHSLMCLFFKLLHSATLGPKLWTIRNSWKEDIIEQREGFSCLAM